MHNLDSFMTASAASVSNHYRGGTRSRECNLWLAEWLVCPLSLSFLLPARSLGTRASAWYVGSNRHFGLKHAALPTFQPSGQPWVALQSLQLNHS